jgi:uncharacterized RDD family membrane protein YckC
MNEPHLASADFGGFWIRFLAVLVDSAIVFLVMALIIAGGATALGEDMAPIAVFAAWLFAFLYWPVLHSSPLQGTFGKALLRLRVTGYQGTRISFLRSLGRELAKILSGAVFMIGYILAGFTARKQSLHDLVASTYVVREGKPRIVPALAVLVASFVAPVVAVPMFVAPEVISSLTAMAEGIEQAYPPSKPAAQPPVVAATPKPPTVAPTPAAKVEPAPLPNAKMELVPSPAKVDMAAAPVSAAAATVPPAAAPAMPVVAVPTAAEPAKPAPQLAQPTVDVKPMAAVEPKAAEPKQATAKKVAARKTTTQPRPVAKSSAPVAFQPKTSSGLKYNDLVTAVLYRDAEAVAQLIKLGRWADKPDSRGTTPLMLAVEQGDARTAQVLLKAGAEPSRAVRVAQDRGDAAMLDLLKRYAPR